MVSSKSIQLPPGRDLNSSETTEIIFTITTDTHPLLPSHHIFIHTGCTEKELSFINSNGELLYGIYTDTGSKDVVILCHGYMANNSMCQFPLLALALASAGVSSFRFDHPMAYRSKSQRNGPFLMGNHEAEVADYVSAVDFITNQLHGSNDKKKVTCLLGHSKGGINVILYAAKYHGSSTLPKKLVSLSGRFRVKDGILQRFGTNIMETLAMNGSMQRKEADGTEWNMTLEDFRGRYDLDMEAAARSIGTGTTKVLVLHGTGDGTIPWEEAKECAEMIGVGHAELVLIEGADHNYTEHGREMAAEVAKFVLS
jgi:alpha-beta hydrolase superfamily lysophospholipase